ncbi:MAG: STAS domain-containing protein [Verrucomicrobiota bacterium]
MTIDESEDNDLTIMTLAGEADLTAVPLFQEKMRAQMKKGTPKLIVDFSDVTFVNTPVWAVIVEYYQHTIKKGGAFAIAGLKDRVEASFNIVRLGEFIKHFSSIDEARQSLETAP